MHCQLGQMGSATGRRSRVGKKISRHMSGIQTLNKRQEIFKDAIEGKLTVQQD